MLPSYCYWSVCNGDYGAMMENCVRTARAAGVFKEFHVLSDRPLEGCRCYDAYQCDKANGLFKLHYLKVGMSRLPFDYFVWLDADTRFFRNPVDILGALQGSPVHIPLEVNLSAMHEDRTWTCGSCFALREACVRAGISNEIYLSGSSFWIVKREAIDVVYEVALEFWNKERARGCLFDVDAALGVAMQLLCGDPEAHTIGSRPDLWATDYNARVRTVSGSSPVWEWQHPLTPTPVAVRPAIVHSGRLRPLLRESVAKLNAPTPKAPW